MIDCQPPAMSYRRAEVLALPFKRRYEKIEIMPEVSHSLSHGQTQAFHVSLRKRTVPEVAVFWPKNADPLSEDLGTEPSQGSLGSSEPSHFLGSEVTAVYITSTS